jgi:asparagine synthetase B (glutamine-hydrolysing)
LCGIYGVAGLGIWREDLDKVYPDLAKINILRGEDSTGIYEVDHRKPREEKLYKEASDACYFMWQHTRGEVSKRQPILQNIHATLIMGHNRKATVGDITDDNAQPFAINDIVLAHNGTLVDAKYNHDKSGRTSDTFHFATDVADNGLVETLHKLNHQSAYAISMYDRKKKKLYFAYNGMRPLYFAVNQKRSVLYWSSERDMLRMVLGRHNIDYYETYKVGEEWKTRGGIFTLAPGAVWSVDLDKIRPHAEIFTKEATIFYYDKKRDKIVYTREEEEFQNAFEELQEESKGKEKEVKKAEVVKDNIVPFAGPYKHKIPDVGKPSTRSKSFVKLCSTCGTSLSVHKQWEIRNNKRSGHYRADTEEYFCECVGTQPDKKSVNETTLH